MLIDLAVGWLDPRARYVVTGLALGTVGVLCLLWCALPLLRGKTIVSTAREVDESVPQLEERWSTVTELAESKDPDEVRGSPIMINQVCSEADLASAMITPESVISAEPLRNASRWFFGIAAALVVLGLVNFSQARVLLHRFWIPGDNVSLTKLSVSPADAWVAKGEPLTLIATVEGRVPNDAPKLIIRPLGAPEKEVPMDAKAGQSGTFQHSIEDVSASFEFRAQAGDGQTPWHRIEAIDRPEISSVRLKVTPPAYSHLPGEQKDSLPHGIRVLQGSEVTVAFKCNQDLEHMFVDLGEGRSAQLTIGPDQWYEYRFQSTESFNFAAVAINRFKLENKIKPTCRVSVYEDQPPSVKVVAPNDELTILPNEKVKVTFEASDDFGLAKAELVVTTSTADGESKTVSMPVPLGENKGARKLRTSVSLDPAALGLKNGDQLTYVVRVTDTKQTPTEAGANANSQAQLATAEPEPSAPADPSNSTGKPADNPSSLLAKAADSKEPKPAGGSQPPPNEMSKRMLDAGQCSSCKACRITVDEWAGTFEGEKRQKLEIAIAPVLDELEKLLKAADEKTNVLKSAAALPEGLQADHSAPLAEAIAPLVKSEEQISGLKSRTSGTPYSFVGLQLHNIGAAHVTPAHRNIEEVVIPSSPSTANAEPLDQASFHITRAREMLADLTRTFENVKREQKIADALQKLAKMHQIFIEDTQALLGGAKGPINSYQRKIAEVNDEYVEKLKALLEEKKKVLAELSKLLSEDPRLLRRFLAMQQLECSSLRDQMTLLAQRQKALQEEVSNWNQTSDSERAALLVQFRRDFAAGPRRVLQEAVALREKMETWLPLDVKPETKEVESTLRQAEKIVRLTEQATRADGKGNDPGMEALEELRSLRDSISKLTEISSTDKPRMAAYIANRSADIASLVTSQSAELVIQASLDKGDFTKVAEVAQGSITQETATLSQKLEATEQQVARLSQEIADKAALLNKTVKGDIVTPQAASGIRLANREIESAGKVLDAVVPAFAMAEETFDELMRLIIAKLDEAPAPNAPGGAPPQLESLLAMLQDEMKACETLGIPCRPTNVMLMTDWMKPGSGMGQGMGQAQAQAAQAQAQQAKSDAERLEKEARENARKAGLAAVTAEKKENAVAARKRAPAWNKLASSLQNDLLQGRDNNLPEQYRSAIENYFKVLSEAPVPVDQ